MRLLLSALLLAGGGTAAIAQTASAPARAAAPASATVDAPVLARTVEKGDRLSATDFEVAAVSPNAARNAIPPRDAVGMEATRRLMAGQPVRGTDLARPQVIRRGEAVTIAIVSGALSITTAGRALSGGGLGEPIRVVSLSTNRTLDGVVEQAGRVRVAGQ